MNYCQLTMAVTALANALAGMLNEDEISVLAALLTQLGDTLATINTHKEICEARHDDNEESIKKR
ncbi:MAG: DUF6774 domain-containing protein [Oscillospiraceae bacterium]|nr:DUF6774 domain-containing protein [Oscillospiraceae bacterium]